MCDIVIFLKKGTDMKIKMLAWSMFAAASIVLTGCGSSGQSPTVKLDKASEKRLASAVSSLQTFNLSISNGTNVTNNKLIAKGVEKAEKIAILGKAVSDEAECQAGGTISVNGDDDSDNGFVTIVFEQCRDNYGTYADGTMTVKTEKDSDKYSVTLEFDNFHMKDGNGNSADFTKITETVEGDIDGPNMSLSITGSGKVENNYDKIEFDIRKFDLKSNTNENKIAFGMDVSVKSNCIGGWIVIKTTSDIVATNDTLSSGTLVVEGEGNSKITYEALGNNRIKVTDPDGESKEYESLDDYFDQNSDDTSCQAAGH